MSDQFRDTFFVEENGVSLNLQIILENIIRLISFDKFEVLPQKPKTFMEQQNCFIYVLRNMCAASKSTS